MNLFARPERTPSLPEFIGLMALMQSLVALTIDAMIPACRHLGLLSKSPIPMMHGS